MTSRPESIRGQVGPLTRAGVFTALLGIASYIAGWQLGWIELMVIAAACLVALLLAVPFVLGRPGVTLQRRLEPSRVTVGEPAVAEMIATNTRRRRARGLRVEERVGTSTIVLDVPTLAGGQHHETMYALPTDRRGVFTVGPAVVTRGDSLGLLRRIATHTEPDVLWVYPRWSLVPPLPVGFAKDLEGPTSDASPAGEVAFHAIRPYQHGDDPRHIHWMSTARTGSLMVRQYVDNRRPNLCVILDTDPSVYSAEEFEVAIEVAASLTISSLIAQLPISAMTTASWLLGRMKPGDQQSVLEQLTELEPTVGPRLVEVASHAIRYEPGKSAVALITGRRDPFELVPCASHVRRHARPIVITVGGDQQAAPLRLPGARQMRVGSLDEFRLAWNGVAA